MPIQFPDFQRISFDEANPWLTGMERGMRLGQNAIQFPQDLRAKILANQIAQAQAKYAEPMAKEGLTAAQQKNEWNPRIWNSEIGLRGAQTNLTGQQAKYYGRNIESEMAQRAAETRKTNYMLEHPGFMGGDETKSIEALKQMGLLNDSYQQPQSPQQPQMPQYPMGGQNNQPQQQPQQQNPNPMQGGGFAPMPGNQQAEQMQQRAQTIAQASQIAQAVQKQQEAMNIPRNQVNNGQGSPNGQGFDVNSMVQALIQKPMTDLQYKKTLTETMKQNLAAKDFDSMPSIEKQYAIAQARGFGYSGEQATKMLRQGYDLASLANKKGYKADDPSSWPIAKGAPTQAIQTRIQRANSTLAALNVVEPAISAAYSKYSPRFNNVSPSLIKDMISGENPDDQADALAAYALYPEVSALRINAMGGNVGEGAIQHVADAAYSRLNTLGISPNSSVYQKVQKKVSQLIRQMNKAENAAIYGQVNRSYEDDDRASANGGQDFSHMSDAELQRIAGG